MKKIGFVLGTIVAIAFGLFFRSAGKNHKYITAPVTRVRVIVPGNIRELNPKGSLNAVVNSLAVKEQG